jgi:hypothetical protein
MLKELTQAMMEQPSAPLIAREKSIEIIIGAATSAVGFFCALLVNSYLEHRRDKRAYRAILESIKQEAESNSAILKEGFERYYKDGLVLRALFVTTVSQGVSAPLFTKNASANELRVINRYLRNIMLANAYRQKAEQFRTDEKGKPWLKNLVEHWGSNISDCHNSVAEVLRLD